MILYRSVNLIRYFFEIKIILLIQISNILYDTNIKLKSLKIIKKMK